MYLSLPSKISLLMLEVSDIATKKKPVAKPYNGGTWTASRMNSFIKGGLRALSRKWPQKYAAINLANVGRRFDPKTGKESYRYKCAGCGNIFKSNEVQADHIDPVVSIEDGFIDWNEYIKRLLCEADNYQVLCVACHGVKTENERKQRKKQ
jgi:hypothetical protein